MKTPSVTSLPPALIPESDLVTFTALERDFIRLEFMVRFGQARLLREGILLRRWASGPSKGQIRLTKAAHSLLDHAFITLHDPGQDWPVAHFTPRGWTALHHLAGDPRQLDPHRFAHLHQELAERTRHLSTTDPDSTTESLAQNTGAGT